MRERRVVVTGVGVVSPIGNNRETFWEGLISGRNGIDLISRFDPSDYSSRIAGEVKDFDPLRYIEKKKPKRWIGSRNMRWMQPCKHGKTPV